MTCLKGNFSPILGCSLVRIDSSHSNLFENEELVNGINELGRLSTQNRHHQYHLKQEPATSCEKILHSANTLYLTWEYDKAKNDSHLLGILRVSRKQLYLLDKQMQHYEGIFVCMLDFYVHYSAQRRGLGQRLFNFMMENERIEQAYQLAFDDPSMAMLRFLAKNYGLEEPIWQNTNLVVFPQLFAAVENTASEHDVIPPEGWSRSAVTPRHINNGISNNAIADGTRFLEGAISGHSAVRKARLREQEQKANPHVQLTVTRKSSDDRMENATQLQHEARQRKQHVLSSKPLW